MFLKVVYLYSSLFSSIYLIKYLFLYVLFLWVAMAVTQVLFFSALSSLCHAKIFARAFVEALPTLSRMRLCDASEWLYIDFIGKGLCMEAVNSIRGQGLGGKMSGAA